jgi:DNA-binding FadR family transcriptional regulator
MSPRPVAPRTLHGQVLQYLGQAIVSGEHAEGSTLPVEEELAAQLRISRGGLREVVKALSAKGLLATRPAKGTTVLPRSSWNLLDVDVIAWHQVAPGPAFLLDLIGLRQMVEPEAAALTARRGQAEVAQQMATAYDALATAATSDDVPAFVDADVRFHTALFSGCGNELVEQLGRTLATGLRLTMQATAAVPGAMTACLHAHERLLQAVSAGDADAAQAMARAVLASSSRDLLGAEWPDEAGGGQVVLANIH